MVRSCKTQGGIFNGFTDIFDFLIPALKEEGLTDTDIDLLLVKNPQEAFTIKIRTLNPKPELTITPN